MKRDNWCKIKRYIESLTATVQDLDDGEMSKAEAISDIRALADDIYFVCDDDYYDSGDEDLIAEYDEVVALLPDTKLSLAEMLSLKETIQKWRDEHGYPNP